MKKAIFFDRDGVINKEIYRRNLKKWTAPHKTSEVIIKKDTINVIKKINKEDFILFVISNQPDYALGYVRLKNLKSIHKKIKKILSSNSIFIKDFFYSYRHKNSLIKKLGPPCFDKKPNPYFLKEAKKKYNIDLYNSWMIGDRQTDIECGKRAGTKTIGIINNRYEFNKKKNKPDFIFKSINKIIDVI